MAATKINDVIVPEVFTDYLVQKTVEKNAFLASGIATSDPSVILTRGGRTVNIPFWKNLGGSSEVLSDSAALTVNKVDADGDVAAIHARGIAYGVNNLATLLAGDDPMRVIADKLADKWNSELQIVLTSTLKGAFGVDGLKDSVNDQSLKALDAAIMIDSMFLLGDNFQNITAIAIHSAVLGALQKLNLVESVVPSGAMFPILTYMGKRIIVDDALAPTEKVFPIYFFGAGAFAWNENPTFSTIKTDEDILTDESVIASRRVFTMHPRGVKWIGNAAGATPSNAELANPENWQLVEDRKNVNMALLKVKIA